MKQLVETVCKALVDNPDEVKVTQIDGEQTTILELRVAEDDLGKIIGRHGRTAKAMRTVINAAATKESKRAVLEILESDHPKR